MLDLSAEAPANETKFDLRVLSRIGCIRNWVEAVDTAIAPSAMQRRGARLLSAIQFFCLSTNPSFVTLNR